MAVLKRVMMIAGEPSGDLHGSGVVHELKKRLPGVEIFGVGGDMMLDEGMELVHHISSLSFMGFVEVVKHLSVIRELERKLEELMKNRQPEVVVLIDYPGLNLRLAKRAKRYGVKVLYYISPQVWAWHKSRVRTMRTLVDRMKVVFPFEVDIYRRKGMNVEFVGHPLVEKIGSSLSRDDFFRNNKLDPDKKLLALLPGSRKQEIEKIFPTMIDAAIRLQEEIGCQIAVGVASNLGIDFVRSFVGDRKAITLVEHSTYNLMAHADAAIVTSGTATLETGWFGTPMAVVYKTSPVTYTIGRALVGVPYIGLVNIVAGEKVVPEFVQREMTADALAEEMKKQLSDEKYSSEMRRRLAVIKAKLGKPGASAKVAEGIIELGTGV